MDPIDRRTFLKTVPAVAGFPRARQVAGADAPFGQDYSQLDAQSTGQWWKTGASKLPQIVELNVARDQVVAFALYTHDARVLKLTAHLYTPLPAEPRA